MLKQHNQVLISLLRIMDMFLALGSWELAYQLRFFWVNLPLASMIPDHEAYWIAAGIATGMTGIFFSLSHVYRPYNISRLRYELLYLIRGQLSLLVALTALAFFYREFSYSRVHLVYFMSCFFAALLLSRLCVRLLLRWLHQRGTHVEHVLVIGGGNIAFTFIQRLKRYESSGILFKGLVLLDESAAESIPEEIHCLGSLEKLSQTILEQGIDQVFIALPSAQQGELEQLKEILSEEWVDVKIVPDLGSFRTLHTEVESFEDIPVITIIQSPMTGWSRVLKRVLDLVGAFVALILFAPVMALVSILIKLGSSGPILYHQERMGLDGVTFHTLKFRSMRVDAEEKTGAVWAKQEDDRRTRLGTTLRKFNLDELPQLFNVLKGEMSLVGPRPERPVFIHQFKSKIPDYMLRHKVKAGMTGWAQVNGWRGNTSLEKRIECDLYYIERWSLIFDLKILFLTLFKGFVDPNAY